jgi:hypothetical protein
MTISPSSSAISSSSSATAIAVEVVKAIADLEGKYQRDLNHGFVKLSEGEFKALRRPLPVTRQKVDWEKIGGYRVSSGIHFAPKILRADCFLMCLFVSYFPLVHSLCPEIYLPSLCALLNFPRCISISDVGWESKPGEREEEPRKITLMPTFFHQISMTYILIQFVVIAWARHRRGTFAINSSNNTTTLLLRKFGL